MRFPARTSALSLAAAAALLLSACDENDDPVQDIIEAPNSLIEVTNAADSGEGSFRAAVETANNDADVRIIQFRDGVGTIAIAGSVEYTANRPLIIEGAGATLDGAGCGCDALVLSGGGSVEISNLTVQNAEGTGIVMDVPSAPGSEVVTLTLNTVIVEGNGLHGVHLDDQAGGDTGTGSDSGASVRLEVVNSLILNNGFREDVFDYDGIRVDEGGAGDLEFRMVGSRVEGNAGDGVELDETGAGDVVADVRDSRFDDNGTQPQNQDDLEDGFDIDEAGEGTIDVRMTDASVSGNSDEGVDLDEDGPGDIRATLTRVVSNGNTDENIKFSEDVSAEEAPDTGSGSILATFVEVTANQSADDGVQLEEFGPGDLNAQFNGSVFRLNGDDGIDLTQAGAGEGLVQLSGNTLSDNEGDPISADGLGVMFAVDRNADDGVGSLRGAIEMANDNPSVTEITVAGNLGTVALESALEFTGPQPLTIDGKGTVLDGSACDCNILEARGGGSLTLKSFTLRDASGNGVFMELPADASGEVALRLHDVTISGVGLHGAHVDDQAPDGVNSTGGDSPASIYLEVVNTTIRDNGFRPDVFDFDGIRVDEGGAGELRYSVVGSTVTGNAGDGIELDEKGEGSVRGEVADTEFRDNGSQPQNPDDLEDGFDIDEAGPGSIDARFTRVVVLNSVDEGIDLDEEGPGDIIMTLVDVTATGSTDENIKASEDADAEDGEVAGFGGIVAQFTNVIADASGDDGVQLEEFGAGDLNAQLVNSRFRRNGDDGIDIEQVAPGAGLVNVLGSLFEDNEGDPVAADGVDVLFQISNNADAGPGTLRSAIELANGNASITTLDLAENLGTISIRSALVYSGEQPLLIDGKGTTVDGSNCDCNAFEVVGGGDFSLQSFTIQGAPGNGILVDVPADAGASPASRARDWDFAGETLAANTDESLVSLRLHDVTIQEVGLHGIHVDDQAPDEINDSGGDSDAGIYLELVDVTIRDSGFRPDVFDFDGVRVDEGGMGDLRAFFRNVTSTGNAGDGIELDEKGPGNVLADVQGGTFDLNGTQPQNTDDLEDGFDIDEAGDGFIQATLSDVTANGNADEGIDLDEEGAGDVFMTLARVTANGSNDENIKVSEDADAEEGAVPGSGGIIAQFTDVTANGSGDDGVQLEEFGAGNLNAQVVRSTFANNGDEGVEFEQLGPGTGLIALADAGFENNGGDPVGADGVDIAFQVGRTGASLAEALAIASEVEAVRRIDVAPNTTVTVEESLAYTGRQPLTLASSGTVLDATGCDCSALVSLGGGDLTVEGFTVTGAGENGIYVEVPEDYDASEDPVVSLILRQVEVRGAGLHGVLMADQAGGNWSRGWDTDASLYLEMVDVTIAENGYRLDVFDFDGVRVDEGGLGDIRVFLSGVVATENAGDGIELDERGDGSVFADVRGSSFNDNGSQPQNIQDLEDGFDIDEGEDGSIEIRMTDVEVRSNFDEGIDLDEEGAGDIHMTLVRVTAEGHIDENIKATEDADAEDGTIPGGGNLIASFDGLRVTGSTDDGIQLEEFGAGDLTGQISNSDVSDNAADGIDVEQAGSGVGFLYLRNVTLLNNGGAPVNPDGVTVIQ